MRVFLDTNVLVSAFATRGLCEDVLRLVLTEHTLVSGEVILEELTRVLRERFRMPPARIKDLTDFLRDHEVAPRPRSPSDLAVRDEDDRWVLACAVAAQADILVTGDRDLLEVAASAPLRIVDPRGFWELAARR